MATDITNDMLEATDILQQCLQDAGVDAETAEAALLLGAASLLVLRCGRERLDLPLEVERAVTVFRRACIEFRVCDAEEVVGHC